jgi:hypothetical protein
MISSCKTVLAIAKGPTAQIMHHALISDIELIAGAHGCMLLLEYLPTEC